METLMVLERVNACVRVCACWLTFTIKVHNSPPGYFCFPLESWEAAGPDLGFSGLSAVWLRLWESLYYVRPPQNTSLVSWLKVTPSNHDADGRAGRAAGGPGWMLCVLHSLDHNLLLFFPHISYSFADSKHVLLLSFYEQFSALKKTNTKFALLLLGYGGTRRR